MITFGQIPSGSRPVYGWPTYSIVGVMGGISPNPTGGGGGAKFIGWRIDETEEVDLIAFLSSFVAMQERSLNIEIRSIR